MSKSERLFLSGNEAIARAALDAGVALGCGYPGTPSTEILESFSAIGGRAQWAPNEKVALEVAIGAAFAGARTIATMKHVGLNVAADPFFTAAYTTIPGGLVVIVADDPGMASSQNEQDSRRHGIAAGVPVIEPASSQEAYDYLFDAIEMAESRHLPVLFRVTTRICHSKSVVLTREPQAAPPTHFERDIPGRVMIPAYARKAHKRMRANLAEIATWAESCALNRSEGEDAELGIISAGIATQHAREAAPGANILQLGMTHPLPMQKIAEFRKTVKRCVVIEEGDPVLADAIRAAGIDVESKAEMYRFGELNVGRVKRILAGDESPEPAPAPGKPPQLCTGCPHRIAFEILRDLGCAVAGDIGCYSLGVLPPFEAMDTCVCMGSSIGVGLGLRHTLPEAEARKVVSVIGDSTFVHSGLTGLVEMQYNRPATGHLVLILDNGTTAMTGLQEHPGTGRTLGHEPAYQLDYEKLAEGMGLEFVRVIDPTENKDAFRALIEERLSVNETSLIIVRRPCILAAVKIREYEKAGKTDA